MKSSKHCEQPYKILPKAKKDATFALLQGLDTISNDSGVFHILT
jgi:hypothetical protein